MTVTTVLKSACAVAVLAVALAGVAEAKGGSGGGSKGSSSSKGSMSKMGGMSKMSMHRDHDHRRYGRSYYGESVVYASYGSCSWLKVRALETGSRYWWARYEACES